MVMFMSFNMTEPLVEQDLSKGVLKESKIIQWPKKRGDNGSNNDLQNTTTQNTKDRATLYTGDPQGYFAIISNFILSIFSTTTS